MKTLIADIIISLSIVILSSIPLSLEKGSSMLAFIFLFYGTFNLSLGLRMRDKLK